jgi:hypothetical protein
VARKFIEHRGGAINLIFAVFRNLLTRSFTLSVPTWRRPSIRSIAIEEEDDDDNDDEKADPEMGPDRHTIQNTISNTHNNLNQPIPPFTITK